MVSEGKEMDYVTKKVINEVGNISKIQVK